MKPMWLLFALFLVIGVVILGVGVNDYIQQKAWFAQAVQADGTLTAYDLHVRHDGKSEYCPRIEFTTKAGEPATSYGDICPSQPNKSQIGQHVTVYYNPNDPSDTRSRGWLGVEGSGLFVGAIGFVFFTSIGSLSVVLPVLQNWRAAAKSAKGHRQSAAGANIVPQHAARGANALLPQDAQRYHASQQTAEQRQLQELQKQEAELKRKIEERRRQGH